MPVIRSTVAQGHPRGHAFEELVVELGAELQKRSDRNSVLRQPIILEQELPTGSLHVVVIWEKWRRIAEEDRSRAIMEAYDRAAPDRVDSITIAMPATTDQAISLGLIPFGIVPTVRQGELDENTQRELMLEEGAVETPSGLKLRFPTQDDAEVAYHRLVSKTRPEFWAIARTLQNGDEN